MGFDEDPSPGQFHEYDQTCDHHRRDNQKDQRQNRQPTGADHLENPDERFRKTGGKSGEEDQGNAVADTAFGDLLA